VAATPASGARQLSAVAGFADPGAGGPPIIGGDFNALPTEAGLGRLYSSLVGGSGRFIELAEERSGNPEKGRRPTFAAKKIDYVFLSAGFFTPPRASTVATTLSDHRAYVGGAVTRCC
jgi:endonuclease/exonuclease/phosphatase family metal-dependent hydrolase